MREILASIDIGSYKIKLVVGEILHDELKILCALDEDSRGVKKGAICDSDELQYAIKKLLNKCEELLGIKITKVLVSINEDSLDFKTGEAIVALSDEGEVTTGDVVRSINGTFKNKIGKNMELVCAIPIMYKVDDRKTRSPKGMRGTHLSCKTVIITAPKRDIEEAVKTLSKCGLEVIDIIPPSIGSFYAFKAPSHEMETGAIIDIGYETTNIGIINKGILINNLVLGLGGKNIDNDLSFIYKVSKKDAQKIKDEFAYANKRGASKKEVEEFTTNVGDKIEINQVDASEVCMSRVREILNMAKNEINYLTKKEISYIIITGGLSEFKEFSLEVESVFGNIATIGNLNIIGARDNKYACSIGMIKYFDENMNLRDKEFSILSQDELDLLSKKDDSKGIKDESIIGKVFGMFK